MTFTRKIIPGLTLGILLGAGFLTGCLSRPNLVKQSFTLSAVPVTSTASAAQVRTLSIKRPLIAAPFDDQSLTYRTGEFSYERDPYSEFLVPPAEDFAFAIGGYFRNSGCFSAVSEPASAFKPDAQVEIFIDELYGDFRNRADASAVLAMRFIFFDTPSGLPGNVWMQKGYSRQVHLKARTAPVLVEGWNEALNQIMAEVCSDLKTKSVTAQAEKVEER